MKIKVLGPGCAKCRKVYENAKNAMEELGVDSAVEKVADIDKLYLFTAEITESAEMR